MRFSYIAALTLLLPAAGAQDRAVEVQRPSRPVRLEDGVHRSNLIVVKFVERHRVRLNAFCELHSPTGLDLRSTAALIGDRSVERMFTRPVAELDEERTTLMDASQTHLADLNNYFYVHTYGKADSEMLLDMLLDDPNVETAYPEWSPEGIVQLGPPSQRPRPSSGGRRLHRGRAFGPNATTPDLESRQNYFKSAPEGFGHLLTRGIDGAEGLPSQLLVHLEASWIFDHEDTKNLVAQNVIGTRRFMPYDTRSWRNHGSACVGILNAGRNVYGVRGFASLSRLKVTSLANGSANMISLATAQAKAGDVFTSSFAFLVAGDRHAPADFLQACYDAIKIATAKGICYTFDAGNSSSDLGDVSIYGKRYAPDALSSGGFIIGATSEGGKSRVAFSNYGEAVIANGWGAGVATTGYGNLFGLNGDHRHDYTDDFGGTSAAGPLVAGVIASLQGASIRQTGKPLTPAQVRAALKVHGTEVSGNVGLRPDLVKLMKAFRLLDGLRVAREAEIGGQLDLELSGDSGRFWTVLMAPKRGRSPVGLNRDLLLDEATNFVVASGSIPSSGSRVLSFPVPNDKGLSTHSVFAQALDAASDFSDFRLSNSIAAYIR